ncbi:unnamed protein product [Closterium sp. Naga37s-1]|nr:unnamed protein product [Closterium sp. Naga37s-1]
MAGSAFLSDNTAGSNSPPLRRALILQKRLGWYVKGGRGGWVGVDQVIFTHHPSAVLYSSKNGLDESLRYLSLYDNRYLRYFKGHRDKTTALFSSPLDYAVPLISRPALCCPPSNRLSPFLARVVSLCMSPKNDSFLSGALDHTVRLSLPRSLSSIPTLSPKSDAREGAASSGIRSAGARLLTLALGRPAVAFDQQGLVCSPLPCAAPPIRSPSSHPLNPSFPTHSPGSHAREGAASSGIRSAGARLLTLALFPNAPPILPHIPWISRIVPSSHLPPTQGLMRVRGRPAVAFDQQGLVFAVAMGGGAVKLFDARSYEKGPFDTMLVGGDEDEGPFDTMLVGGDEDEDEGPFDTMLVGGDEDEVTSIKFSNDGNQILVCTLNGRIYLLDAFEGQKLHTLCVVPDIDGAPLEASFSPDAKYVVSGSGDGTVKAWSATTGAQVATWGNHAGVPSVVKWAPRRLMFATASVLLALWIPDLSKIPRPG